MRDTQELLTGALIGGLIGGVAGLLLAPQPGNQLRKDLVDVYGKVGKNSHAFMDAVKKAGYNLSHPFAEEEEVHYSNFLIGSAIGAVVAGIAALLLAPDSGQKIRKVLGRQYDEIIEKAEGFASQVGSKGEHALDEICDWKDTLVNLISKLSTNGQKKAKGSNIDQILDLAHLGTRLFHQFKGR